jgi:hypothetical protein
MSSTFATSACGPVPALIGIKCRSNSDPNEWRGRFDEMARPGSLFVVSRRRDWRRLPAAQAHIGEPSDASVSGRQLTPGTQWRFRIASACSCRDPGSHPPRVDRTGRVRRVSGNSTVWSECFPPLQPDQICSSARLRLPESGSSSVRKPPPRPPRLGPTSGCHHGRRPRP